MPTVWAVSDLHGAVSANSERIAQLTPPDPADWLIVAGDVAERTDLIIRILRQLKDRYARVIWVPGNHELFSRSQEQYQGRDKYTHLVEGVGKSELSLPKTRIRYSTGLLSCRFLRCMTIASVHMVLAWTKLLQRHVQSN